MRATSKTFDELLIPSTIWNLKNNIKLWNLKNNIKLHLRFHKYVKNFLGNVPFKSGQSYAVYHGGKIYRPTGLISLTPNKGEKIFCPKNVAFL